MTVAGTVQGVGFRPFVARLAGRLGVAGWVANTGSGVALEIEGAPDALARFRRALVEEAPPLSTISHTTGRPLPAYGDTGFVIRGSAPQDRADLPRLPPDTAACGACRREVATPTARRYRYPFTNCTHCGPRYTIVTALPYDRARTSMRDFPLCPACAAEYADPDDRRYHAQPIACPACGPRLELSTSGGQVLARGDAALRRAAAALRDGLIVALKALGGYQLLCDARDERAVQRLRARKRRAAKPFAVMVPALGAAAAWVEISAAERRLLLGPSAPIVLLRRRTRTGAVPPPAPAPAVAPGSPCLGVMLPTTPLHQVLLQDLGFPVVCTSGNLSQEPIAIGDREARTRLAAVADLFLGHDRPIVRPLDDSVARTIAAAPTLLRRARGYAPEPLPLVTATQRVLAVGGHLKSTVALAMDRQVLLSQHLGDLDTAPARRAHQRAIDDLLAFTGCTPELVACDLHPDYATTAVAEHLARRWAVPLVRVQHHHAHVAACAAEHGLAGSVLGVAWDGTGYGADGSVWGGEFLRCDLDAGSYQRRAYLLPFGLPGGEHAVRDGWRSALGALLAARELEPPVARRALDRLRLPARQRTLLEAVAASPGLAPRSSSVGRLFDAVAALLGVVRTNRFEGEAALALEDAATCAMRARRRECVAAYPVPLRDHDGVSVADWRPMLLEIARECERGAAVEWIAARFHASLAALVAAVVGAQDAGRVVLSGGCFQNALLTGWVCRALQAAGRTAYVHRRVPPNDGGLSLGQVAVAAARAAGAGVARGAC